VFRQKAGTAAIQEAMSIFQGFRWFGLISP
jgi:hypothetical protein